MREKAGANQAFGEEKVGFRGGLLGWLSIKLAAFKLRQAIGEGWCLWMGISTRACQGGPNGGRSTIAGRTPLP